MKAGYFAISRIGRRHFLVATVATASAVILAACGGGNATTAAPTSVPAQAPIQPPSATTQPATAAATTKPASALSAATAGQPAIATPATTAASKAVGPATLQVWGGVPPETGPSDLVDAFQKANPSIKVVYTRFVNDPTGNTKLDTALQGGTPIDVYFSYDVPRMGQRIKAGAAEDLTSYLNTENPIKQWATTTKGIFSYQGKFYSLPTTREPNFIFVNKKMADAARAKFKDNWTLDDFRAVAKSLSSGTGDKEVYGAYAPPDVAREILGPDYWYKNGGTESNFDNPAWKTSLELHRSMIDEKSAFPWTQVLAQNLKA
ncbi:MAG TPA: extracellular solute-binding protein, partial [Chloroflexota bacterium]|nr:extracellular solute-binding protein [Chloroflexota bacterium]